MSDISRQLRVAVLLSLAVLLAACAGIIVVTSVRPFELPRNRIFRPHRILHFYLGIRGRIARPPAAGLGK